MKRSGYSADSVCFTDLCCDSIDGTRVELKIGTICGSWSYGHNHVELK